MHCVATLARDRRERGVLQQQRQETPEIDTFYRSSLKLVKYAHRENYTSPPPPPRSSAHNVCDDVNRQISYSLFFFCACVIYVYTRINTK